MSAKRAVRVLQFAATLAVFAWWAAPAGASHLITRNATDVRLQASRDGKALVSYRAGGSSRNVLAWGAINAHASKSGKPQVEFVIDYSGPSSDRERVCPCAPAGRLARDSVSRPGRLVLGAAELAADGAKLRNVRRPGTGDLGVAPIALVGAVAAPRHPLRLDLQPLPPALRASDVSRAPRLRLQRDAGGVPLDDYGRNVYVDTLDSAYGKGWRRENSFLTHEPTGGFCYGFYPHGSRPPGRGKVPRHRDRPRRDTRCLLGGDAATALRPRVRPPRGRSHARAARAATPPAGHGRARGRCEPH